MLDFEPLPLSFITKDVSFINGKPLRIFASIPITKSHGNLIANPNATLSLRVFYNGEPLQPNKPSTDIRLPRAVIRPPVPMPSEMAVMVLLLLPNPIPEDEGVYELQLFVDISQLPAPNCLDYVDFVRTSDGLNLPDVLIGSATLYVRQQGILAGMYLRNTEMSITAMPCHYHCTYYSLLNITCRSTRGDR